MPLRQRYLQYPEWVENLPDTCLVNAVKEAITTRDSAIRGGARDHKACRAALGSGEKILDQIEFGRVTGEKACSKAAVAVRKFNTAVECAHPTARRGRLGGSQR
jgi:hypothetical protein